MRIEYFQLIDRITDLDLTNLTIRAEAAVPTTSTIFEGHFPGQPLMPGVLLAIRRVADLPTSPTVGLEHLLFDA